MSNKNFFTPRYKLIADYPGNQYLELDEIIVLKDEYPTNWFTATLGSNEDAFTFSEMMLDKCNVNFRKLGWWEERGIEEMPQYLKFDEDRNSITSIGNDVEPEVHKVKRHWATSMDTHWRYGNKNNFISEWHTTSYSYGAFVPATEDEYNAHCQTKC